MDQETTQRLAFVRYLYQLAIEQSNKPEPLAAASVLTLHDATELFLNVALSEVHGTYSPKMTFMEFFGEVAKKHPAMQSHKQAMDRLNGARMALKHHANRPEHSQLEGYRASVTNFLEESTPLVFGIEFGDISLVQLVENEAIRQELRLAEERMAGGELDQAVEHVVVAFHHLRNRYKSKLSGDEFVEFLSPFPISVDDPHRESDRRVVQAVDELGRAIQEIRSTVDVMTLGIDFGAYVRFRRLVPSVHWNTITHQPSFHHRGPVDKDDCLWCIQFILETAMRLQSTFPESTLIDEKGH